MQPKKKHVTYSTDAPAHLFLISAAIVMKACSTLVAFLALVSKKGIPISSAKAWFPEQGIRSTRKSVRTNRDGQQPRPGTVEPERHQTDWKYMFSQEATGLTRYCDVSKYGKNHNHSEINY
jgi:hypothetical protein